MSNRIIYTRADGGLSVIIPATSGPIEALLATVPQDALNPQIIDASTIPADRTFRNAWKHGGTKVNVDMPKSRQIHMDRIRVIRNRMLDQSDKDMAKAQDAGDAVVIAALKAQRQQLRNIPQTFDLTVAATPDALKLLWPSGLPQS